LVRGDGLSCQPVDAGGAMYILDFVNLHSVETVDEARDEHRAFLTKHIDTGVFLVAGAKVPRTGGVIIVANVPRERVEAIVAEAPLVRRGLATCSIVEFKSVLTATGVPVDPRGD
jgi:uncharacterized protein YciI